MSFHVRIKAKKGEDIHAFDLSEKILLDRVAEPYERNEAIDLGGAAIQPAERARVTVYETEVPWALARGHARQRAEEENLQVSYSEAGEWSLLQRSGLATDVTMHYLKAGLAVPSEVEETPVAVPVPADTSKVLVVHGRNERLRDGLFNFLRALGLEPIEWQHALLATGKGSPYIGEILDQMFRTAQAVIVQMAPDEEARLVPELSDDGDVEEGRQPRPNVLFEAGMAWGLLRERTIFLEYGKLRQPSDISGIHMIRMDGTAAKRHDLAERLRSAGCAVETKGQQWLKAGPMRLVTRRKRGRDNRPA